MRTIDFSDGFTSESSPTGGALGIVDYQDFNDSGVSGSPASGDYRLHVAAGILKLRNSSGVDTIVGGAGGGSSIQWIPDDDGGNAPIEAVENDQKVWQFETGLAQKLYALVKVPSSYNAGSQINLKIGLYSPSSSNTILLQSVATLIRANTDAFSSTTNQRTSTNSALTNTVASMLRTATLDLTSSSGQINSVAVAAGDVIKVELTRGTDTDTADIRFLPFAVEATFQ